jgi:hypothetical protein
MTAGGIVQGMDELFGTKLYQSALDKLGVPRPETSGERIRSSVTGVLPTAAALPKLASTLAPSLKGAPQAITQMLAQQPGMQLKAAPISAAASQYVAEDGGSPTQQILAGIAAPFAASTIGSAAGSLANRVKNIVDAMLLNKGATRAAGRVIADVTKDDAQAIVTALRNAPKDSPLTAGEQVSNIGRAEMSGLERLIANSRDPSRYGTEGAIPANREEWLKAAWNKLNASTGAERTATLDAATKGASGYKLNANPILQDVAAIKADPNFQNVTSEKMLDFVSKRLSKISDPTTGEISGAALYGLRKDIGLKIDAMTRAGKWDKSVASGLMRDIQKSIDWNIEKASGRLTPQGGPAWSEAYLQPFSKRAAELTNIADAPDISKRMGSSGLREAARISGFDEAPFSLPNLLSQPIAIVNAALRFSQGKGGERTAQEITRLMLPENKQELANVMTNELIKRNLAPRYIDKVRQDILSGTLYTNTNEF